MRVQVGTDVGGTFTDLWAVADDGRTHVVKAPTTPDIISGIVHALELAAAAFDTPLPGFCVAIARFGHGSTAGLNAMLTGTTARTALIITAGFGDTLAIGRLRRQVAGMREHEYGDYTLRDRHAPLIPRKLVFEVPERIDRRGEVVQPLHEPSLRDVAAAIAAARVDAVAVCTLWATANPDHERRIGAAVREALPDVFLSMSHEVSPTVGEYARASTTAANAALGPIVGGYLRRLSDRLRGLGVTVPGLAMTGTGGVVTADELAAAPVAAMMSGPAAGVVSCQQISRRLGRPRLLTVDVGGTSFDVGTLIDGDPLLRSKLTIAGADIRHPSIDVATIGAGGGSIAQVRHGMLSVGPDSAGATPGPACYGRGGTLPTATDADLLLGVLSPGAFAAGRLDVDAAEAAVAQHVAEPLGVRVPEAAWAIRQLLDSRMADLLRRVTIERGHDPREFVLVAGGGSGPSHAWALCAELGITTFVVPAPATGQSAYGTGTSDLRLTAERSGHLRLAPGAEPDPDQLTALAGELEVCTRTVLERLAEHATDVRVERTISVRYRGQAHHLDVPLEGTALHDAALAKTLDRFERD